MHLKCYLGRQLTRFWKSCWHYILQINYLCSLYLTCQLCNVEALVSNASPSNGSLNAVHVQSVPGEWICITFIWATAKSSMNSNNPLWYVLDHSTDTLLEHWPGEGKLSEKSLVLHEQSLLFLFALSLERFHLQIKLLILLYSKNHQKEVSDMFCSEPICSIWILMTKMQIYSVHVLHWI